MLFFTRYQNTTAMFIWSGSIPEYLTDSFDAVEGGEKRGHVVRKNREQVDYIHETPNKPKKRLKLSNL